MSHLHPVHGAPAEVAAQLRHWLAADAPAPLVVETSGSTGRPKRVLLSQRAVRASAAATTQRLGAQGRWALALPATYVAGLMVLARSLLAGHDPALLDGGLEPDLSALPADVAFCSLVPTQLQRLLDDDRAVTVLRGLHTVLLGGGPIDPRLRVRAEEAGVPVVATYGSAETCGGCVYDGRPLPGVELGTTGEGRVTVAGPVLFEGYEGDPELTAAHLVNGRFLTSDVGELVDGRLRVLGRADDVVVSGGLNVPLPAVAARLRAHPEVAAAEVLGVDDAEWGQRVVAFVVGDVDLEELRAWVAQAHPRAWAPRQLVALGELPLLANGKADREMLRGLA